MIDRTCADLEGTFPYVDDTRVGSPDREMHLQHLDKLFSALTANGLAINLVPTLEFLGHRISAAGSAPTTDHTAEMQNCSLTQDSKQLQCFLCFLGMVNFYRHFVPNCAQVDLYVTIRYTYTLFVRNLLCNLYTVGAAETERSAIKHCKKS